MRALFFLQAFVIVFSTISANTAFASRSALAPVCNVAGKVISVETRKEPGRGMSEGETFIYTDVTIDVSEVAFANKNETNATDNKYFNCSLISGTETYQLQSGVEEPEVGACIAAKSNYLADGNFTSGNWLYDIKDIDEKFCN